MVRPARSGAGAPRSAGWAGQPSLGEVDTGKRANRRDRAREKKVVTRKLAEMEAVGVAWVAGAEG
ncbi:hypothetical protein, partial [Nocardia abscessus]|uniref:hypothetical protein n=1 Tax=Nocardia abscessus TaxID=120957 RepID=UPI002455E93C